MAMDENRVLKSKREVLLLLQDSSSLDVSGDRKELCVSDNEQLVRMFLDAEGNINVVDDGDRNILHILGKNVIEISEELANKLIEKGVDLDQTDTEGNTALHYAVINNNYNFATTLLYSNADPCVPNNEGYTPFMLALVQGAHEIQSLMLDFESDFDRVSQKGESVLYLAAKYDSKLLEEILNRGASVFSCVEEVDEFDFRQVFKSFDTFRMIWELIDYRNLHWGGYHSALGYAVYQGTPDMFEFVIKSDLLRQILDDTYMLRDQKQLKLQKEYWVRGLCSGATEGMIDYTADHFTKEKAFEIIHILLSQGYEPDYLDAEYVFRLFGRSQLFDLCLELDLRPSELSYEFLLPSIILQVSKTVEEQIEFFLADRMWGLTSDEIMNNIESVTLFFNRRSLNENFEEYCIEYSTMNNYIKEKLSRKFPSLQELSRDAARTYICKKYKVTRYADFQRTVKMINIGQYSKILAFKMPIY